MKAKIILFTLILVLCSFTVLANGFTKLGTYDIIDCVSVDSVKVTGTQIITPGEYYLQTCNELTPNNWNCTCKFSFYSKINAINSYTITVDYVERVERRSGGGGGSYTPTNKTQINITIMNTTTNPNTNTTEVYIQTPICQECQICQTPTCPTCATCQTCTTCNTTQEIIEVPNHKWRTPALISFGIIFLLLMYILYKSGAFI